MSSIPIFKPNNHSIWQIRYESCPRNILYDIKTILIKNYSHLFLNIIEIEHVIESGINSQNFKVTVNTKFGQKIYLLRKYSERKNPKTIQKLKNITDYLIAKKIKIPTILMSKKNKPAVVLPQSTFQLFDFVDGQHFQGTKDELASCATEIGRLDCTLQKYEIKYQPIKKNPRVYSTKIWIQIFTKIKGNFGSELLNNKDRILNLISETPYLIVHKPIFQIVHFDLHPHNLLTDGKNLLAIIDLDSLHYLEKTRGVSFAIHRLIRQRVVLEKPTNLRLFVNQEKENFIKAYRKFGILTDEEIELIPYFIRAESLSRLTSVAKNYIASKQLLWPDILQKTLTNIAESYYF